MYRGFYLRYAERMDPEANARVHALTARLVEDPLPGVTDLIPGYGTLYVEYDPRCTHVARVRRWVKRHEEELEGSRGAERLVEIPVRYDGPDLKEVARHTGLSVKEVVQRHSAPTYRVYAVGFVPGFPFMGEVDPRLRVPRRPTPRQAVPAHAVGIAGAQTGVYPLRTPGGWHLLGYALVQLYDPKRPEPFLLGPGDRVRFVPREGEVPPEPEALELWPTEPAHPVLRVEEEGLLDLLVDQGRFCAGRFGLARSGALDPLAARYANALVGNPPEAPLLELTLKGPVLTALRPVVVGFAGWGMVPEVRSERVPPWQSVALRPGDTLRFVPTGEGVRGYLAVAGGLEVRRFWGSASVDLKGKIGRPLRAGDVLGVAAPRAVRAGYALCPPFVPEDPVRLRVLPGPQATPEALEALTRGVFEVTSANRMGLRLGGPRVPGGEVLSEAAPIGAVQVPPSGAPIVLLADRGTLGGYAKPAVVHPADLPKAAQVRPGQRVRFVLGTPGP
ncbi:5-oxoprolinase subunit PxpB [Marinithermus hydrothermalis]|uniref:Urea carboxylase n=1 Tax=Marinithermus hydrothermalis (strain DSM 14884 / JCM 11576 / T1) TaxID=869210 RepID=F2NR59_MARHT|nr:5-oxoprolinase subunit PxpB [Marinithermus hydrothermalis]AEB12908.1 Conserved hypothetical protein CHP00370 [Marinithermus hydrothermalis DSM 14884]